MLGVLNASFSLFFALFAVPLLGLAAKLFVQEWYVIVPLCLVEVSSHRIAQFVFLSEFGNFETATIVTTGVRQTWFIEFQLAVLLVHQENVTMQTRT